MKHHCHCERCGRDFVRARTRGDMHRCQKCCSRDRVERWKLANPIRAKEINTQPSREAKHRYQHSCRGKDLLLRRLYGISLEDYERMLSEQNNACAICAGATKAPRDGRRLAVDHDHVTGRVRGILCTKCNTALGWYERHASRITKYLLAMAA